MKDDVDGQLINNGKTHIKNIFGCTVYTALHKQIKDISVLHTGCPNIFQNIGFGTPCTHLYQHTTHKILPYVIFAIVGWDTLYYPRFSFVFSMFLNAGSPNFIEFG